jgi:hypothetical protein
MLVTKSMAVAYLPVSVVVHHIIYSLGMGAVRNIQWPMLLFSDGTCLRCHFSYLFCPLLQQLLTFLQHWQHPKDMWVSLANFEREFDTLLFQLVTEHEHFVVSRILCAGNEPCSWERRQIWVEKNRPSWL